MPFLDHRVLYRTYGGFKSRRGLTVERVCSLGKFFSIDFKQHPLFKMVEEHRLVNQGTTEGHTLADNLLARCQKLLHELEEFRSFVNERKAEQEHAVDIRKFQTSVNNEYRSLQKVPLSFYSIAFRSDNLLAFKSRPFG